jgi:hypothetical protein
VAMAVYIKIRVPTCIILMMTPYQW